MGNIPCVSRDNEKEVIERLQYNMQPVIDKHLPVYWIIGPISSGKSKQAELLANLTKYDIITVKKCFKDESMKDTERGRFIQDHLEKALRIPTEITLDLVKEEMLKCIETSQGYILTGFPQTLPEADLFVKEIYKPQVIFFLNVKFPTIMERLSIQDSELAVSTVQNKLTRFRNDLKNIRAVFDHKFEKIDGNASIEHVFSKIQTVLKERFGMDLQPPQVEGQYQDVSPL